MPLTAPDAPAARVAPVVWGTAAGLLALHAALAWYLRSPGIGTGNDDAVYLLLARSLRNWSYADLFYVGAPIESQYPPLYPAFLALLGGLFGEHVTLFIAANVMLSVTALALLFDVVRRQSPVVALLTLAWMVLNPILVGLAGGVRSEPLCMALTALALWLLARPASRQEMIWAGAAAIGAALTRSAAITLVAGVGTLWLLRRRWGAVALLGVSSALTVGSWLAWTVIAPRQLPGRSYIADAAYTPVSEQAPDSAPRGGAPSPGKSSPGNAAGDSVGAPAPAADAPPPAPGMLSVLARRIRVNVPAYARTFIDSTAVPTVPNTRMDSLGWLLLLTTLGAVGLWGLNRWWPGAVLALILHLLLLAVWPYTLPRYLAPLIPFLALAIFWGAREAETRVRQRLRRPGPANLLPLLLAAGILLGAVPRTVAQLGAAAACRPAAAQPGHCGESVERAFFDATAYIARATPDTARFFTAKEAAFHYYTGRQVVPIYGVVAAGAPELREYLARSGAAYVFLSHLKIDEWALARPLLAMCRDIELVRSWGPTTVLLRISAVGEPVQQDACAAIQDYAAAPWGNRLH